MLATDWKAIAPDVPEDLVPAAYAISGVYDLTPLLKVSLTSKLIVPSSAYTGTPKTKLLCIAANDWLCSMLTQPSHCRPCWRW